MELAWTDDLNIGNAVLDSDHKILLGMVNRVINAIKTEDCKVLSHAFELLETKLRTHFEYEENIARAVNFSYAQHMQAEQYFLREIDLLKEELLSRNCECCAEAVKHYSDTLGGLLIDHIAVKDVLMKPVLQNHPYNLSPALS